MAGGAALITHNEVLGMDFRCPEEPIFSVLRRDLGRSGDSSSANILVSFTIILYCHLCLPPKTVLTQYRKTVS